MLGAAGRGPASNLPASLAHARAEHLAALARAREATLALAAARRQAAVLEQRGVREAAKLRAAEQRESETADRIEALAQGARPTRSGSRR